MKRLLLVVTLVGAVLVLLAAPALAGAATFNVAPSGGNDTHNIQKAFNRAVRAGPGSIVQLSAGHFYMNNITVDDFDGSFKGAGKGKTVIDCLRGLDPSLPGVIAPPETWSFFIRFRGGYPRVSGMTFDITAEQPCEPWFGDVTLIDEVIWVRDGASSSFDRVGFKAHALSDEFGDYNAWDAICLGPTGGVHTVTRCSFAGFLGLRVDSLAGATLTVGGSATMGNVFETYYSNIGCCDNSDSDIELSYNQLRCDLCSILVGQSTQAADPNGWLPPLPAPRFVIRNNTMICSTDGSLGWGGEAVWLADNSRLRAGEPNRLEAVVANNTIVVDNGGIDAGIAGAYADDIKVLNNRISGTGMAAITVETAPTVWDFPFGGGSGWQIIGNDVSGLHAVGYGGRPPAQIWLGEGASHCLVIGGCRRTTVLDEGTDNTLINVKELVWSPSALTSRLMAPGSVPPTRRVTLQLVRRY